MNRVFYSFVFLFCFSLMLSVTRYDDLAQAHFGGFIVQQDASIAPDDTASFQASLQSGLQYGLAYGNSFADAPALRVFYKTRNFEPFWILSDIQPVVEILKNADAHGLDPERYNVGEIVRLQNSGRFADQALLELLLSDGVVRYGRDMTGQQIDPSLVSQHGKFWRQPMLGFKILSDIESTGDPAKILSDFAPKTKIYKALQGALSQSLDEIRDLPVQEKITLDTGYFKPGRSHKNIPLLRERMNVIYPEDYEISANKYDDFLAAAVERFQAEHGLDPDGIIGPKTLALINRTPNEKLEQIVANMERLRWRYAQKPGKYIEVNIATQMLKAVEKGRVVHHMPVVVGSKIRQTEEFNVEADGVRFNPTWTVPMKLKMQDFLPKLRKDPNVLASLNMELYKGYGRNAVRLDPLEINWNRVGWREMGKIRMVQTPGDHNALGRIRVLMHNEFAIYLHDTNHPEVFERTDRTASSGCVRLSDPAIIAHFMLSENDDWSNERMEELLDDMKTKDISAEQPVPVYIYYQTIWFDEDGQLVFGPDVYGRDKKLANVMKAQNIMPQSI